VAYRKTKEEARLADTGVADEEQLEEEVAVLWLGIR
jgi:hypothetical protein